MKRRAWLKWAGLHCAGATGLATATAAAEPTGAPAAVSPDWAPPPRFARPQLAEDENGIWSLMDREEARLRRSPFRLHAGGLEKYLLGVCCKLAGEHCPDIRVYAMREARFNASMAPNGMMQVWSGLLLRVENEAQLAAVLGHEIGHYLQRHSLERMRDMRSRASAAQFMGLLGVVGALGQLATMAGAAAYSRDHERDADQIGVVLMRRAGYDPRESPKLWSNLLLETKANPSASEPSVLFANHPPSEERQQTLSGLTGSDTGQVYEAEFRAQLAPLRVMLLEDELKRSRPRESVALLERLTGREPGNPALLHFRGEAYRARGDTGDGERAVADYQAAIASGNPLPVTWRSLGQALLQAGQPQNGRQALSTYLALAPQAPDAALIKQVLENSP